MSLDLTFCQKLVKVIKVVQLCCIDEYWCYPHPKNDTYILPYKTNSPQAC